MSNLENSSDVSKNVWEPSNIFVCPKQLNHAVVILNRNINLDPNILLQLWHTAVVKMTVDGGTDQWIRFVCDRVHGSFDKANKTYLPDIISGDFDSILPDTLEKAKTLGLNIIETADQNETDYTKAIRKLQEYCDTKNIQLDYIYTVCDTSGRFDHIIANINTLYKCEKFLKNIGVIQISNNSLTWLLTNGNHKIRIPDILVKNKSWCGLIPFGNSANCISTTGLKWDLDKGCLKFGELVSTSNTYVNNEVTVDTNIPIVWTMGIRPLIEKYSQKMLLLKTQS